MTLFRKTLLFFIGVIAFQSVLSILLVTDVTRRANLADARQELEEEATILYDGFNAWKRQMWICLIGVANDRTFARSIAEHPSLPLKERLLETKMDALFVRGPGGRIAGFDQTAPGSLELRDLETLTNVRTHPYIEMILIRSTLALVGVASMALPDGLHVDIFLIKRVDADFCTQLVRNRKSQVAILQGGLLLAASSPGASAPSFFDPRAMQSAYRELYAQRMSGTTWNAAFQKLGRLDHEQEGDELYLGTFISNGPYDEKLLLLDRTILLVSLAGALLTLVLSLFLSRNITHPIAELLAAMRRIGGGALETTLPARGGDEISSLFRGFNEMSSELVRQRAAAARALRETVLLKDYNEKIIDSIRAGIAIVNRDLVVEKANNAFVESFALQRTRVVGAPLTYLDLDIVDEGVVEKIFAIFRKEREFVSDIKRSRDGRVYEIRLYPFYSAEGGVQESSGCVFMADDISAKTQLEQKIFQAEKLATVSMLSAGMAHEINNPLGSILTNVQNLIEEETMPARRVSLKWIEQETRRIARIVQGLLNFASDAPAQGPGSDVNAAVQEVVGIMSHSVAREGRIRIDVRLAPNLPPTVVGTDELKQVVINLLSNAVQAITGPGRILVSTRAGRSGRIVLAVADTGAGMPRQIIPRIFDPFFTTKANGEGTGLGLSVVYGIVTKYAGTIDVRSREGRGSRFCLGLPHLERRSA